MINLLPPRARAEAAHEYWRRLLVVCLTIGSGLILAGLGLLVPIYLTVRAEQQAALRAAELGAETLIEPSLTAAAAEIQTAEILFTNAAQKLTTPRPSAIIALLVAVRSPGVVIRQINYAVSGTSIQVTLGGVASTREELLAFRSALNNTPGVVSADFPTADLAASSMVAFSIKIKYTAPAKITILTTKKMHL